MSEQPGLSRRQLLASAAGLGALWTVAGVVPAAAEEVPPGFPAGVELYRQAYRNWAGEIVVQDVWTCAPASPADVVAVVNWARSVSYRVRAVGYRHGWAPLTIRTGDPAVILVDTTRYLTAVTVLPGSPAAVRAQAGAAMEHLLGRLEVAGYGLTATPAPGDISVGGALAIDGHGTAVPAVGEVRPTGATYGSLSNLVVSLTAVVWDPSTSSYALRTFDRAEPDCAALLTHLGRTFVTEVTLRVRANANLQCVSRVDIDVSELFAAPGSSGRTFARFVDSAGRIETILFAFTTKPWIKTWHVRPTRPLLSRPVSGPYNYTFSDNVPQSVADLTAQIVSGQDYLAPQFGSLQYDVTAAGLITTLSADIWGPSKNVLLYIKPTTIRMHANGYAVLTSRANIQRAVHEFYTFYANRLASYANAGKYPVNGVMEIRATGLDDPSHVGVPGATTPALSAVRPHPDHPEWDVAIWFDVLSLPGTPHLAEFYREIEQFMFTNFAGYGATRVEWSKGWAYTATAPWSEQAVIGAQIPASLSAGGAPSWADAVSILDRLDPHYVFTNPFLTGLLR